MSHKLQILNQSCYVLLLMVGHITYQLAQPMEWEISGDDQNQSSGDDDESSGDISTSCMHQRIAALQSNNIFIPRCTKSGEFHSIQCDSMGNCWCSTKSGQEIPATKTKAPHSPNCPPYANVLPNKISTETTTTTTQIDDDIIMEQSTKDTLDESKSKLGQIPFEIEFSSFGPSEQSNGRSTLSEPKRLKVFNSSVIGQPGILAGIIGGTVVSILCIVLLVMFVIYRMRQKQAPSIYVTEKSKRSPAVGYMKAYNSDMFT